MTAPRVRAQSRAQAPDPSSVFALLVDGRFPSGARRFRVKAAPVPLGSLSSPPAPPVPLTPSLMPRARGRRKPSTRGRAQWHCSRKKPSTSPSRLMITSTSRSPTSVARAPIGFWVVVRDERFGVDYEIASHCDYWDFIGALVNYRQCVSLAPLRGWRDVGALLARVWRRCQRRHEPEYFGRIARTRFRTVDKMTRAVPATRNEVCQREMVGAMSGCGPSARSLEPFGQRRDHALDPARATGMHLVTTAGRTSVLKRPAARYRSCVRLPGVARYSSSTRGGNDQEPIVPATSRYRYGARAS